MFSDELNGNTLTVKLSDGKKEETVNIEGLDKVYCGNGLSSTVVLIRTE